MTSVKLLRVLVVEDSLVNQKVLTALLAKRDCTTDVARDGQEAIDLLVASQFDLILMDVQMPIMDGMTDTRLIREGEAIEGDTRQSSL
jgi:CheY-like chemotaxis protein